jgi:hypothetical protein
MRKVVGTQLSEPQTDQTILDDVQLLHRQRNASVRPFGTQLRCSGCHINGGLLQKELAPPHNDWFTRDRQLPLGTLKPDSFVKGKLADMTDAGELSELVAASARRLADSPGYRKVLAARSMQEQLRPLFCPMELNIESDSEAFDDRKSTLRIPSAFFVDPRLGTAEISVRRQDYDAALRKLHSRLPETPEGRTDADHGWLTPVKAHSDLVAVESLIEQGVVSKEFAVAVLARRIREGIFWRIRSGSSSRPHNRRPSDIWRSRWNVRSSSGHAAPCLHRWNQSAAWLTLKD